MRPLTWTLLLTATAATLALATGGAHAPSVGHDRCPGGAARGASLRAVSAVRGVGAAGVHVYPGAIEYAGALRGTAAAVPAFALGAGREPGAPRPFVSASVGLTARTPDAADHAGGGGWTPYARTSAASVSVPLWRDRRRGHTVSLTLRATLVQAGRVRYHATDAGGVVRRVPELRALAVAVWVGTD